MPLPTTAPPRSLACLGLLLILLSARGDDAGPVATELVYPNFTASSFDTGGAFLKSSNGAFRAAVFNPGKQQASFFLGVLHEPSGTVVWSANRGAPTTSSGRVRLSPQGLTLSDSNGTVLWSTPSQLRSPVAALRLQDNGNLQLLDAGNATLWQSFDNASDTLLPGQQLLAGSYLSAARSATDLSEGDYRLTVTAANLVLTWQGTTYWRLSNDVRSYKDRNAALASVSVNASGLFALAADGALVFRAVLAAADFRVLKLGSDGRLRITSYTQVNSSESLGSDFVAPAVDCDLPLHCPSLGLCTPAGNSSSCTCPPLFAASASASGACTPGDGSALASRTSCRSNSSAPVSYLGLNPQTAYFATKFDPPTITGVNDTACRGLCTAGCTCLAYFHDNSSTSCYLIQEKQLGALYWSSSATTALGYIKTFHSAQNATRSKGRSSSTKRVIPIVLPSVAAFLIIAAVASYACWKRTSKSNKKKKAKDTGAKQVYMGHQRNSGNAEADEDDDDIVIPGMPTRFSYMEIATMTDDFGTKVGSGGFGSVYKGELPGGEGLVAVKKLEAIGTQAKREFCTEIAVIGNIRHVNLVRLRGFCAEGSRRLLVYEYMNRGSLDRSLFGRTGPVLEWGERMEVAIGAARGLAYLHAGCDQKIVHCDVKPENILLADGGQVKIADFGLAKLMSPEQSALFTTMRGTRGYLAPEWLSNAAISDRADVYSFGMVLLELIHGRKNRGEQDDHVAIIGSGEQSDWPSGWSSATASTPSGTSGGDEYFPMVALEFHEEGRYLDLVDQRLEGRADEAEAARAVRVALCCLHEDPTLRPSMSAVVRMLEGSVPSPEPRVEALGFLRLYGRGYAAPTSMTAMAGTSGSLGTPSTPGASQLNDPLQDTSAPR